MLRRITLSFALVGMVASGVSAQVKQGAPNVPEFRPAFKNQTRAPAIRERVRLDVQPVAVGLQHPWGIAVLPDGGYLVTERTGRLNHIAADGTVSRIRGVPDLFAAGQGGLLDVAIGDDFAQTRRVFLTYTKPLGRGTNGTAAGWGVLSENNARLSDFRDIFVQTPGVATVSHFGSRIVLDGDWAFVTVGDRNALEFVQDFQTTVGKVVRIGQDGSIPESNPFVGNDSAMGEVWSLGHRNPQGASINPATGELWVLEHGPKGGDELNRVLPGQNYGWPVVSYGEDYSGTPVGSGKSSADGFTEPRYYWDPVIAPGGFTFYSGDLFKGWTNDVIAAALAAQGIVRLKLKGDSVIGEARYLQELGRIRDVAVDRDGALLVLTDDPEGGVYRVVPR